VGIIFISAAAGFSPPDYTIPTYKQSDKVLHFLAFFFLTLTFYWILETSRRKVLQLTFTICTLGLAFASEIVQGLLPVSWPPLIFLATVTTAWLGSNPRLIYGKIHREFDYYDIIANVTGSLIAIGLCNWYHKRMLERKRAARGYTAVAGDDERDIELGDSSEGQESGIVRPTVDEELEQWDEHAEDWETTEPEPANGKATEDGDLGDSKKRSD
jgi:hypothetical protein